MKSVRIFYKFSLLNSMPEVAKINHFYKQSKFEEASGLIPRCLNIFRNMGNVQTAEKTQFCTNALNNELYLKNYNTSNQIIEELFKLDPSLEEKYITQYYLTSQIIGKKSKRLSVDSKLDSVVAMAARNIISRDCTKIIQSQQISDNIYKKSQRIGSLIGISNYLTYAKQLRFKSRILEIAEGQQTVSPIIRNFNLQFGLEIDEKGHDLNVQKILPKLNKQSLQLFPISYLIYSSKCYNRKQQGNWATLFLKHSEQYSKTKLYRPLALLSMILFNSQNYVSSQGLIASSFDHMQKQQKLKKHTEIMLNLCKARIINQIKGRQKQAEYIREQNLPKFDQKHLLINMIL